MAKLIKSKLKKISLVLPFALMITVAIFLSMQALIKLGAVNNKVNYSTVLVDFINIEESSEVRIKNRVLKKPPPPPKEPPIPRMQQPLLAKQNFNAFDGIGLAIDMNLSIDAGLGSINSSDGQYLPIVKISPVYPRRAAQRGIEGYVLLEFTVNSLGAVVDPIVLEAKPAGVFNRSAIEAAKKFLYKPKIFDGKPVSVTGVRNIIRFKLKK